LEAAVCPDREVESPARADLAAEFPASVAAARVLLAGDFPGDRRPRMLGPQSQAVLHNRWRQKGPSSSFLSNDFACNGISV
jgi:hypothetical protein